MKNILVATDFSHDAYCALFYATKLLASKPSTFFVLNVFNENTPWHGKQAPLFGNKKRLRELKVESKEKLTETYHKIVLDDNDPVHRFQTLSKKGILTKVVKKTISEFDIDLVVMGNKGQTGSKEIFLGSNTTQVANALNQCPLLAVPKQIDYKTPKEIAFVTDLKQGCTKETLSPMLLWASWFHASIRIMHITEEELLNSEQESNRKLLEQCLQVTDHSYHKVRDFDDKALVIKSFLKKLNIDLFAMVNHKHSFFEMLVREPVINDVSIYAGIPMLILPKQN